MSAINSDLSNPKYGYDFVVATTQKSINATMKTFLAGLPTPMVQVCFVADPNGNPTLIDHDTLVKSAKGSDPFKIPADADPANNADLQNLIAARFMAGFLAQLGLPAGYSDPTTIPDLVELGTDTSAVTFNMLCSQFLVTELVPGGGYNPPTWTSLSQPLGNAWIIQSKVDLRFSVVDQSAYSQLPPDVQAAIQNLGGDAFSVRQLLLDLENAGLASQLPTIQGIQPGSKLYSILQQYFLGAYFSQMQKGGQPLLGAAVTQNVVNTSTLSLTNLSLNVQPFLGTNGLSLTNPTPVQQGLATLDYLCEANGNPPLPAVRFGWNWVEAADSGQYHGVTSINRKTFATYLRNSLQSYAEQNCYLPSVRVTAGFETTFTSGLQAGQVPTVIIPPTGSTVLSFSWSSPVASDEAGLDGALGKLKLSSTFDMSVSFSGNTITVTQRLVVYMYAQGAFGINSDGNIVDRTFNDVYTVAVTQDGNLSVSSPVSTPKDNSVNPDFSDFTNFFSGNMNNVMDNIRNWAKQLTASHLQSLPLSAARSFVFPGGQTFAFKTVSFSDNQDLVSQITYANRS